MSTVLPISVTEENYFPNFETAELIAKRQEFLIGEAVSEKVDLVATDESGLYASLSKKGYPHASVNQMRGEYIWGNVHTQTIDGFWSLLRRRHLRGRHSAVLIRRKSRGGRKRCQKDTGQQNRN